MSTSKVIGIWSSRFWAILCDQMRNLCTKNHQQNCYLLQKSDVTFCNDVIKFQTTIQQKIESSPNANESFYSITYNSKQIMSITFVRKKEGFFLSIAEY